MKVNFRKDNELIIPIDKLSTFLFDAEVDVENLKTLIESRKPNVQTAVTVRLPRDETGNAIQLTQFDRQVFIAALSEIAAGYPCTTYSRIFHLLGGGRDLVDAPNIQAAISESFSKLRRTEIRADLTALVNFNQKYADYFGGRQRGKKFILEGAILPTQIISATVNGKITDGAIKFLDVDGASVLLKIAQMKKQLIQCDSKLLAAPCRCTVQTAALNGYLLERVLRIKGSNDAKRKKRVRKLPPSILFDTIFLQCGISNDARAKCRKIIAQIFQNFVAEKLITKFTFTSKNEKFYSIVIEF